MSAKIQTFVSTTTRISRSIIQDTARRPLLTLGFSPGYELLASLFGDFGNKLFDLVGSHVVRDACMDPGERGPGARPRLFDGDVVGRLDDAGPSADQPRAKV